MAHVHELVSPLDGVHRSPLNLARFALFTIPPEDSLFYGHQSRRLASDLVILKGRALF